MKTVIYDGSFEGLLTAVFEIYEYRFAEPYIVAADRANGNLFDEPHRVQSDPAKAKRINHVLKQRLSQNAFTQLYKNWLSELPEIENILYRYIKYVIDSKQSVENNYGHPDVLMLQQINRKVHREKHRMEAFVRFQLTKDSLYYCIIQPDYNVLPLISNHFEKRYADQRWLIYDSRRKYGIYYDLDSVREVSLDFNENINDPGVQEVISDAGEELYQQLWCVYFNNVNIAARKNMKLHIQHMPKRYWRYLTEKRR